MAFASGVPELSPSLSNYVAVNRLPHWGPNYLCPGGVLHVGAGTLSGGSTRGKTGQ